ncbi:hypothetical protein SGL43_03285 [Streptomyces globisporus]|uniref:Uncharacterized protein n=1 Tax=Streptomyces globisporus TaxID=1908 RepID=A0ABN8V4C1_STRGL|nr:hypothetical protein SGL43_03285 [Streptomyces globisporus]
MYGCRDGRIACVRGMSGVYGACRVAVMIREPLEHRRGSG